MCLLAAYVAVAVLALVAIAAVIVLSSKSDSAALGDPHINTTAARSSTGSDLPEHAQLELIGLFDTMYGGTLLFPNPDMPYEVAATTWPNLMGCHFYREAPTLAAIQAFGKATWGIFGGEPVLGRKLTAPTLGPFNRK